MPANIQVTLHESPGGAVVGPVTTDQSRDDLRKGYQVVCRSVHEANTYSWALAFTPDSSGPPAASGDNFTGTPSTASLLPPEGSTSRTAKFNVDWDGPYLIRLVVDAGLPTEDTMFLRLRVLTRFGDLKLVSAGERRDQNGVVPVDADPEGWTDDQNQNLHRLLNLVRRLSTSGRTLYVDANRGRDNAADQNDPANILRIPGPDSTALDETGIRMEAEGFADFYSVNDAITYAMGAVGRGEPAPSLANPYFIRIKPGYYEEDLNLQPHIHLIGEAPIGGITSPGTVLPFVQVRSVNAGGSTHHFNGTSVADFCFLFNLYLENVAATTNAVVEHTGGLLALWGCIVYQRGNAVNQGAAIRSVAGSFTGLTALFDSVVASDASANDNRYAIIFDIPSSSLNLERTRVLAQRSGVQINPSMNFGVSLNITNNSLIDVTNGYGIRSAASVLGVSRSEVHSGSLDKCLVSDGFGNPPGSLPGDQQIGVLYSRIDRIVYDTAIPAGNTTLRLDAVEFVGPTSSWVQFPNGVPDTFDTELHDRSVFYDSDYEDPGSPGTPVVPVNSQLGVNNVQDALDLLVRIALPLGNVPYYSLDSAYDGLASVNPLVYGSGLGRLITADQGAVKIEGATYPLKMETDGLLRGGIQQEGVFDLGPVVSDGKGSEVNISPDPFGGGPMITLGRSVWPDDFATTHRGFPGALIIGGNPHAADTAPDGTIPYNVFLRTRNNFTSPTSELGRVVIDGGTAMEDPTVPANTAAGGWVFIQGGSVYSNATAEDPGYIVLAPGQKTGGAADEARVRIVRPDSATRCTLTAQNVFVGGVAGNFWVATPNGVEVFAVGAGDNLAAVIATINSTSRALTASNAGGKLRLTGTPFGPTGDVLYVGDDQSNALNVALGELRVNSGAVFVPGTFGKYVDVYCDSHGELTVDGDLHANGDVTAGGICCGGGGGCGPTLNYQQYVPAGAPYNVGANERIIGVVTTAAPPLVILPVAPPDGRVVAIKDESGNAGPNPIIVDPGPSSIDGVPIPFPWIAANWVSMTFYYSAAAGAWFIM